MLWDNKQHATQLILPVGLSSFLKRKTCNIMACGPSGRTVTINLMSVLPLYLKNFNDFLSSFISCVEALADAHSYPQSPNQGEALLLPIPVEENCVCCTPKRKRKTLSVACMEVWRRQKFCAWQGEALSEAYWSLSREERLTAPWMPL